MTPSEFKAWFEGFTEAFSGTPTKAQWARIKERVAEIDGKTITERVFVDRWYPYIHRTYPLYPNYTGNVTVMANSAPNASPPRGIPDGCWAGSIASSQTNWNSSLGMNAVGRAEAAQLAS